MSSQPALAAVERMVSGRSSSRSLPFACELAQAAQRDLDVARAQFLRVVVVAVGALVPDLHRRLVAALAADADALRVLAAVTERRGAAGADPLAAAFVAFLLFFEPLFQRLHQLVPVHLGRVGDLLGREDALHLLAQPVGRDGLGEVRDQLHALEVGGEGAVELVVVLLVLDQRGAGQEVEVVHGAGVGVGRAHHIRLQCFEQRQVFLDRDRQLGRTQGVEEVDQHGDLPGPGPCQSFDAVAARQRRASCSPRPPPRPTATMPVMLVLS